MPHYSLTLIGTRHGGCTENYGEQMYRKLWNCVYFAKGEMERYNLIATGLLIDHHTRETLKKAINLEQVDVYILPPAVPNHSQVLLYFRQPHVHGSRLIDPL
jgi:hypothetical protein